MNKKYLFKIIAPLVLVLIIILGWLFVTLWSYQKEIKQQKINQNSPTAKESANWEEPFLKPIKVEFLDKEEKQQMNLADNPNIRLQAIEKDENGKVTAYKKIYREEDVVHYVKDFTGTNSLVVTSTATTTAE